MLDISAKLCVCYHGKMYATRVWNKLGSRYCNMAAQTPICYSPGESLIEKQNL